MNCASHLFAKPCLVANRRERCTRFFFCLSVRVPLTPPPPYGTPKQGGPHIVGECGIHKEERHALKEDMSKIDECDMEKFSTLHNSERTIAILGDSWWPQKEKQEGDTRRKMYMEHMEETKLSAQKLKVIILGVGAVLHLEREASSMVNDQGKHYMSTPPARHGDRMEVPHR